MQKILIPLMIVVVGFGGMRSWAANYSDPIEGVFKGVYGNTISVEVPSLVSKSPTSDNQNGDLSFQLNASTGYTNFSQLSDLRYGDPVRVQYSEDSTSKENQKVAIQITKLGSAVVATPANIVTTQTVPAGTQMVTTTTTTRVNEP